MKPVKPTFVPSHSSTGRPPVARPTLARPTFAPPRHMTDPGYVDPRYHLMSKAAIEELRHKTLNTLGLEPGSTLEVFMEDVLADHELVQSYYDERNVKVPGRGSGRMDHTLHPITEALRVAERASRGEGIRPSERKFTFIAALVYSCGVFHATHPLFMCKGVNTCPDRRKARRQTALLLEHPLANLRRLDPALGQTMTAVLGVSPGERDEGCDPEQVVRIGAAVYLANIRLTVLALG